MRDHDFISLHVESLSSATRSRLRKQISPGYNVLGYYIAVADPGGGGGYPPRFFLLVSIWKFLRTWTLTPPLEEFRPRTPHPLEEFLDPPL